MMLSALCTERMARLDGVKCIACSVCGGGEMCCVMNNVYSDSLWSLSEAVNLIIRLSR